MHRTTTTATLLVTVAVSALSGCMTVQRPLAPGPATAPTQGGGPRPVVGNETSIVQGPASEALTLVGPSPSAEKSASPSHRATGTAAPERDTPSGGDDGRTRPPRPGPGGETVPRRPPVELPGAGTPARPGAGAGAPQDLCALGREYGGWRADSQEATICQDAYGP
ncbi:hypothetical protein [Streptomyces pilosus]|uniref:hypothetical protein n=1 Tax=Streptomyces pilosus TaxID=28893 RepID=UPI0036310696